MDAVPGDDARAPGDLHDPGAGVAVLLAQLSSDHGAVSVHSTAVAGACRGPGRPRGMAEALVLHWYWLGASATSASTARLSAAARRGSHGRDPTSASRSAAETSGCAAPPAGHPRRRAAAARRLRTSRVVYAGRPKCDAWTPGRARDLIRQQGGAALPLQRLQQRAQTGGPRRQRTRAGTFAPGAQPVVATRIVLGRVERRERRRVGRQRRTRRASQ